MRPIRLLQMSAQGFFLTDAAAVFSGTQLDERSVVDPTDTVLDPLICARGGWIDLPFECQDYAGRTIKKVWYPAFRNEHEGRVITLNRMAIAGNRLLRIIQSFNEGLIPKEFVEKGVKSYQHQAISSLGGKNGVVNSNIIAGRVRHSGRAVLVVNATHPPEVVSLPDKMMDALKLENGDLVILGREPTIWGGSIEVVRARRGRSYCIEVHPLLFKQMGADCDGDTVYVYAVPDNADCQAEAEKQVLGFAEQFAKWPSYLRLNDPSDYVDWEQVHEDGKARTVITGFSVSPREIIEQRERLKRLCATTGKDVSAECLEIALGVDQAKYKTYVEDQNRALVTMKLGMGPIGAAANKLRLIAGVDRHLLESASYFSERLQQILLDTKHTVGRKETYSIDEILAMLNKAEQYKHMTLYDALEELGKVGIETERIWPIMSYIWIVWPLVHAIRKVFDGITPSRMKRMEFYARDFMENRDIGITMRKILMAGKSHKDVDEPTLVEAFYEFSMGIGKIFAFEYPVAMLTSDRVIQDRNMAAVTAMRVFALKEKDASGVTRLALEEALNVRSR